MARSGGIRFAIVQMAFVLAAALYGQEITGNISGTVTDPAGSVIPKANVSATNTGTGAVRTTQATSSGVFFLNNLSVGNYTLAVEAAGFKKHETKGIRVDVNDRLNFAIKLEIGAVSESVEVSAAAVQLQTETSELANLIGSAQTQAMPFNGRVFSQLVELAPGVVSENGQVGGGTGLDSDTNVSINGNQSNSNLWLIDGQNNMDIGSNAQNVVTPPLDALEEFKVLRNNFSAEFGQVTGGVINVVTKQGTRDFHGSVYEFLRNDKLDANDFFLNSSGSPKSELRFNNFGSRSGWSLLASRHVQQGQNQGFLSRFVRRPPRSARQCCYRHRAHRAPAQRHTRSRLQRTRRLPARRSRPIRKSRF